jgi:hypothetical protein
MATQPSRSEVARKVKREGARRARFSVFAEIDFWIICGMLFHMLCPNCKFQQLNDPTECPRCGIIFAKYHPTSDSHVQHEIERKAYSGIFAAPSYMFLQWGKDILLPVDPLINPVVCGGRLLIYAGLVLWGLKFLSTPMETNYVGESFMHMINLPFHEAGHLIFSPVGRFMQVLGGSLGPTPDAFDLSGCIADPKSGCLRRSCGPLVVR